MSDLMQWAEPGLDAVPGFMAALEATRAATAPETWREVSKRDPVLRRWRYFLALDPYTRWGLVKPRGYAGDATLMDFAYGHPSIQPEVVRAGPVGETIYRHTAGAPQSASARLRIQVIAEQIRQQAGARAQASGGLRILSFASGHARELEALDAATRAAVGEFIAIDTDAQSLAEAGRSAGGIPLRAEQRNILRHEVQDLPAGELVYSLGLFDYLAPDHAAAVLRKMWGRTRPGGVMMVANLAPDAANLGYCEAIMDWWMIPRTEAEMHALGAAALSRGAGEAATIAVQRHGCFHYLRMEKPAV